MCDSPEWIIREIRLWNDPRLEGVVEDYPIGAIYAWPSRDAVGKEIEKDMTPVTLQECIERLKSESVSSNRYWATEIYNVNTGEVIPWDALGLA